VRPCGPDVGEAAADKHALAVAAVVGEDEKARLQRRQRRRVAGQHGHLALRRGEDHGVDLAGEQDALGGDELEGEGGHLR
jgi:hypothetical protein